MNKVERRYRSYGFYKVQFKNSTISIQEMDCRISCGIKELENVNSFIKCLKDQMATDEEVVRELKLARTSIKRGRAAHVMASIVENDINKPIVALLEKQREVKVMRPKYNPNSGNRINVIIM